MTAGNGIYRAADLRLITRVLMEHCHTHGIKAGSAEGEMVASLLITFFAKGVRTAEALHEALRLWPGLPFDALKGQDSP